MIRVTVDSRVRVPVADLPAGVRLALRGDFTHVNPEYLKQEAAGRRNHDEPRVYRTWTDDGENVTVPRGGMGRLRSRLREAGVPFTVLDRRQPGCPKFPELDERYPIPDHRLTLYPYQRDVVDTLVKREQGILHAPTGAGKSTCGLALAARLKVPTLVVVWSGNLMEQWVTRATSELGLRPEQVGRYGGGVKKFASLTVAMQQSMYSALQDGGSDADAIRKFGCLIGDEIHRFAAKTLFDSIDPLPARYRIGISADSTRKDKKEFLTYDLFGGIVADIPLEKLVRSGHVLDVEIRVVPTSFAAPWYRYRQDFNKLLSKMREDQTRNQVALDLAEAEVRAGEQVLLFSHRVEHCRELAQALVARGIPTGVMVGGAGDAAAFEASRDGITSGRLRAAVGTVQAIGQGLDLPAVSRGILVTPIASNRQAFGQVRGRICRVAEGKNGARLYVLHDRLVYGKTMVRNLSKWNSTVLVQDNSGRWVPAPRS